MARLRGADEGAEVLLRERGGDQRDGRDQGEGNGHVRGGSSGAGWRYGARIKSVICVRRRGRRTQMTDLILAPYRQPQSLAHVRFRGVGSVQAH
jgi:hypothetical protein